MRILAAAGGLSLLFGVTVGIFWLPVHLALPGPLMHALPCYALGLMLWLHLPTHRTVRQLLAVGVFFSVNFALNNLLHLTTVKSDWYPPTLWVWGNVLAEAACSVAAVVVLARLVALLPDGRYRYGSERIVLRPLWPLPIVLPAVFGLFSLWALFLPVHEVEAWVFVLGALVLVARCLCSPDLPHRRWLLVFGVAALVLLLGRAVVLSSRTWASDVDTGLLYVTGLLLGGLPSLFVPVAVAVAAFRRGLLGMRLVVRPVVIYGLLWLVIGGWYLGTAMTLGLAVGQYLPLGLAVLVTAMATMVGQPARTRLNQVAARWAFGRRPTNFELLVQFGTTLEHAFELDRLAPRLACCLREGLDLRWTRVRLGSGELVAEGVAGDPAEHGTKTLIRLGDDVLGAIECGPKAEGRFTAADHDLVETLARQSALAVHNTRLTAELSARVEQTQRQARELAASRARIVHTQDTERRRIERRLHDGIQQELVALVAKLRLVRNQVRRGGEHADSTLAEVQNDAYLVIEELREFAHGIHPPVLTDQGLVAAVTSSARRLPLPVTIEVEDSVATARFPVNIEESAFFLISEALTNVLKHADATQAVIRLTRTPEELLLSVRDDGAGFQPGSAGGSGLTGMRDRADAVGGKLQVISEPGAGTTIHAQLPARSGEADV